MHFKLITEKISYCVLLFLALTVLLFLQRHRLNRMQADQQNFSANQQTIELNKSQLNLWQKIPTFGYRNLLADWVFLQFLQYFGDDEIRHATGYGLSPHYFKAIIPNDPFYTYFYLFLSGSSSVYAGQPDQTVALMKQGLEQINPQLPDDGYMVWRYKGTDELLFLGDAEAAQNSFQSAADWAKQSAEPEAQAVASLSQRTADFLANNPISKRAQVDAWASILGSSFDEHTRQMAIEKIEALGGQVIITEDGRITIQYPEED